MDESKSIRFDIVADAAQAIRTFNELKTIAAELRKEMQQVKPGATIAESMGTANASVSQSVKGITNALQGMERQTHSASNAFEKLGQNMKHHLLWATSGAILGGLVGVPYAIQNIAKESEALSNKIEQNLHLLDKYHDNTALLTQDMKHLNSIASVYSIGFGEQLPSVLSSISIISRRFKDLDEISAITAASLTMSKIDNVPLELATKSLEGILLQFQLSGKELRQWINDATITAHVARTTGQELFEMLSRSGSAFKQYNISAREALAMSAALITETGKSSSTIGQSWKSVLANLSMDKAIEALEAYNIKLYEVNENGMKMMRSGVNVFAELRDLYKKLDDEGKQALAYRISGGKYHISNMLAFLSDTANTFESILHDIETKSSDAMTTALLRMGLQTYQIKLMQLEASMQVLGKTIGNELLPGLKDIVNGLTNGTIWLTEHKEAVNITVSALIELAKAVMAYVVAQRIANASIGEATVLVRGLSLLHGDFATAFAGMGSSLRTFGAIAASVTLQMAALYAAINIISAVYDRFTNWSGLTAQQQDLSNQKALIEGNRKFALANKARTGMTDDEINAIYDSQISELTAKLNDVNEKKKAEDNKAVNKAQEESERSFKAIVDRAMAAAQVNTPTINNQIPDKNHKNNTGRAYAPDKENELFKLDSKRDVDKMLNESKIAADNYDSKLQLLNAHTQIFGITSETTAKKIGLMHNRIGQLLGSAMEYTGMANDFEAQAEKMITGNTQLKATLDEQRISWSDLTKEEKKAFAEKYQHYVSDYKLLTRLLELSDKLRVEAAQASKEANRTGIESVTTGINDARTLYDSNMRKLGYQQESDTLGLGRFATNRTKQAVQLRYAVLELIEAERRLKEIQDNPNHSEDELLKQQVEVDKLKSKAIELSDTWYTVREGLAGITSELLTQSQSIRQIWNNLWNGLANDAIKALFRVQNSTPSLLGQVLGLFGGGSSAVVSTPKVANNWMSSFSSTHLIGHATGGVFKEPHIAAIAENGDEEAVINISKNDDVQKRYLMYAANKMGIDFRSLNKNIGSEYIPYLKNEKLNRQPMVNVQVQQNNEHISELKAANELMKQQNAMLMQMIEQNSNGGSTNVIVTQVSSDQVYDALMKNPDALQNIIYRNHAMGWK